MDLFRRDETLKGYIKTYPISALLILLNVSFFIVISFNGGSTNLTALLKYGAFHAPYVADGEFYRIVSYMFLHIGIEHFLFNMFSLYVFAAVLEKILGKVKYLAVYLLSGIGSGLTIFFFSPESIVAGASGAIFGVFGSFLVMAIRNHSKFDSNSKKIFLTILAVNIVSTFIFSNVSIAGHIGGLISGIIVSIPLIKREKQSLK